MRVLHILEDYSNNSGGLRAVVKELNQQLNQSGIESYIMSSKKEKEDSIMIVEGKKNPWLYSKEWKIQLETFFSKKKIDVIHIHGVWMYPQFIAAKFAIQNSIPFLISPHGMFEPWLWLKGKLKKKIYFNLISKFVFSKAHVIHAITNLEKENLETLFPKNRFVEIPNIIKNQDFGVYSNAEKYILYIGRLDKKKGIDLLIKAFNKIDNKEIKLMIAGKINSYQTELKQLVKFLNINEDRIEFLGYVSGETKSILLKNAFVFVAPSYSEAVGMVNLEAAIHRTPVITTYQTGLKTSWNKNGGKLINPTEKELLKALNEVLSWNRDHRIAQGELLYKFVIKNYSWDTKLADWHNLYNSLM